MSGTNAYETVPAHLSVIKKTSPCKFTELAGGDVVPICNVVGAREYDSSEGGRQCFIAIQGQGDQSNKLGTHQMGSPRHKLVVVLFEMVAPAFAAFP